MEFVCSKLPRIVTAATNARNYFSIDKQAHTYFACCVHLDGWAAVDCEM